MIEVLVTIVILAFGLLGLVGMQSRLQLSQMEAYQRAQALVLLEDMANRMANNRELTVAQDYVTDTPLGTGASCSISSSSTRQQRDSCEWSNALQGASEVSGESRVGAMLGARGCIAPVPGSTSQYLVTVAWQGMGPTAAPAVSCGEGEYTNREGAVDERYRRAITTIVSIGSLTGL